MNSTTTNSTTCAPFLFTSISVESNPQQVGNICPETIITYIVASIILSSTIFFFVCSLVLLIIYGWRKKKHSRESKVQIQTERLAYIRARNPIIMSINLFTSAGIAGFHTLRYLIGRKIFPCSLLSLSYFLIPPVIFLPTLLRSSRLFNMARINSLITNTRKRKTLSIDQKAGKNMIELALGNNNTIPNPTSEEELASYTSIPSVSDNSSNKQTNVSEQFTTPRKVEFKVEGGLEQSESTFSDTESDVGSLYDVETTISRSTINQLKLLNVLVSNKFIFILYFVVVSCHLLLWLIIGGIEEGIYQSDTSKSRIFAGFLYFTSGCIVNINGVIVVICQAVPYLVAEVILLILCILSERDTYYIKLETFIVVIMQIALTAIFGMSYIGAINRYTEYTYPGGNIVATFAVIELFCSNFLPLVLSYIHDWRMMKQTSRKSTPSIVANIGNTTIDIADEENQVVKEQAALQQDTSGTSNIILLLKHKKFGEQFLKFAERSYCPENILCWRDIEAYKKVKRDASKRRIGQFILATYLLHHSPLELNISKDDKKIQNVEQALSNKSLPLSVDLFDFLQLHCLLNMIDIFERIKSNNKEIREYLKGLDATPSK